MTQDRIRTILRSLNLPKELQEHTGWFVQGDVQRTQIVFRYDDGTDPNTIQIALHESLMKTGFELVHAERQDSFYQRGSVSLSVSRHDGWIEYAQTGESCLAKVLVVW